MRLNPPKNTTWYISLILAIVALLGHFVSIPFISTYVFWIAMIGLVLLLLGNYVKGL